MINNYQNVRLGDHCQCLSGLRNRSRGPQIAHRKLLRIRPTRRDRRFGGYYVESRKPSQSLGLVPVPRVSLVRSLGRHSKVTSPSSGSSEVPYCGPQGSLTRTFQIVGRMFESSLRLTTFLLLCDTFYYVLLLVYHCFTTFYFFKYFLLLVH